MQGEEKTSNEEREEGFKKPILGPSRPDPKELEKQSEKQEFLCPYKVPKYNGPLPDQKYSFEVLKNGVIVDEIKNLHEKPFHVIGRLTVPHVDINSAHPTSSRFHCVLQYRPAMTTDDPNEKEIEDGWYVYDLDSTHGTFLNKYRIKPRTYCRMRVGHQLKLGNSTRCYILQGPSEDEEEQSELTITELKQQKIEKEKEREQKELDEKLERERLAKEKEDEGISWGMQDDAEDEQDLAENPYAATNNEELFISDPKKTLRGFFEREGHDLDYRCDELSPGVFICRIELPIDDEFGKPIICEVQHKGKKKECVVQCALEACRILDRHGVLRQANHEPRRKRKVSESDSDDDNFFDRTGDVEKKRLKKQAQPEQQALTYEQLKVQEKEITEKIQQHEHKLEEMIEYEKRQKQAMEVDDLDSFMSHLSDQKIDKFEIRNLKNELQNLKQEIAKIQKLINIAKPSVVLPSMSQPKGKLPLFGKRSRLPKNFGIKKSTEVTTKKIETPFEVEEDEDDGEGENEKKTVVPAEVVAKIAKVQEKAKEVDPIPVKLDRSNVENSQQSQVIPKVQPFLEVSTEIIKESTETSKKSASPKKEIHKKNVEPPASIPKMSQEEPKQQPKKAKKTYKSSDRYRANIDMNDDDEYIDEEKVSMWLPPTNQKGDGTSHLNERYGY